MSRATARRERSERVMAASATGIKLRRKQWKYLLLLVERQLLHADGKFEAAIKLTEQIRLCEESLTGRETSVELVAFLAERSEHEVEYYYGN